MLLYLLRHGDAVQNPAVPDRDRPLTALGAKQAEVVAQFLKKAKAIISTIFSSPLTRAEETASPLRTVLQIERYETTNYLIPGSDLQRLVDEINAKSGGPTLLVGHEPMMSNLTSLLLAGDTNLKVEFKKCSLALVDTVSPVKRGRGNLKWLLTVDQMEMMQ